MPLLGLLISFARLLSLCRFVVGGAVYAGARSIIFGTIANENFDGGVKSFVVENFRVRIGEFGADFVLDGRDSYWLDFADKEIADEIRNQDTGDGGDDGGE